MLAHIALFMLLHISIALNPSILSIMRIHVAQPLTYAIILPILSKQPFSGRAASAHLHLGTNNTRPKPKHPPPKPTTS